MPRSGGESEKLGARYEGWWTVHNLLDLLSGDAQEIQVEPFYEAEGVEFVRTARDGTQEFHSVKRQRAGQGWGLSDLARVDSRGRSVLKDLFEKVRNNPTRQVVFVSTTVHSQAYELRDRAGRCSTVEHFEKQLRFAGKPLHEDFKNYLLPITGGTVDEAFSFLKRLRIVPMGEDELKRQIQRNVRFQLYRADNGEVDPIDVLLKLADYVHDTLGQNLREPDIRNHLAKNGYHLRDWARDLNVRQHVQALNNRYQRAIESDLILSRVIPRKEANVAVESLLRTSGKLGQLLSGAAGLGKSCVISQILGVLGAQGVPFLAFRMDNLPELSSTRGLGRCLELPDSPALVLAGISHGNRAILAIDQLDAISVVSGRNPRLSNVFEELISEVQQHPNLRILLGCREFDLQNDPRLSRLVRDNGVIDRIPLELLDSDTVQSLAREGGADLSRFSSRELDILLLPFHMYLFLAGKPANPVPFGRREELFGRFWKVKRDKARVRGADFEKAVGMLTDALSRQESISIRSEMLDEIATDAEVLVSENVFILENGRYRFFHESFFDYAFARRFVRNGGDLTRFLTEECGDQHLFRRAQVRQIVAYQRDTDHGLYVQSLNVFLNHSKIRLHLKKLAFEWLAQLENPSEQEWRIILPLLSHPQLRWPAFEVLSGRLPWFDLLERTGAVIELLSGPDKEFVNICTRALFQESVLKHRSTQAAHILRSFLGEDPEWDQRISAVLQFGHLYHSDEMIVLAFDLQNRGLFDYDSDDVRWHSLVEATKERPDFAVEFLGRHIERLISKAKAQGTTNPFPDGVRTVDVEFIHAAERHAPKLYAQRIAPIVKDLAVTNAKAARGGGYYDEIWQFIRSGREHDTADALLGSLRRALRELAKAEPMACKSLLDGWEALDHKTIRFLLVSAWTGNPQFFSEFAVTYFTKNKRAFLAGSEVGLGADGGNAAFRLIRAISPLLNEEDHARLEAAIHGYTPDYERKDPENRGFFELSLWLQLPPDKLTERSKHRIEELQRKFPEVNPGTSRTEATTSKEEPGFREVRFPISLEAFEKMTPEQCASALRKYGSRSHSSERYHDWLDICTPLRQAAKKNREKFVGLLEKLPDDVLPLYFDSIVRGLLDSSTEVTVGESERPSAKEPNEPLLPAASLMRVVGRLHALSGRPCGRIICDIANALKANLPPELMEIVGWYAIHDHDPDDNTIEANVPVQPPSGSNDLLTAGINSARGSAAYTFGELLFAHSEMADRLLPYVEALAHDRSASVRAVNIQALTALLNTHRDKAVDLFMGTCEAGETLWAVRPIEDFLYYATFSHFASLQDLLRKMLKSSLGAVRLPVARQIVLASFRHPEAKEDVRLVLSGDAECRRGAAEIFAANVHHNSIQAECILGLKALFNDSDKRVREIAADWFRGRAGTWPEWQRELLVAFSESAAFGDGGVECMMNLKNTDAILPSEFLGLANTALTVFEGASGERTPHTYSFSYKLPGLVIRYYEQTQDENERRISLDLLDRMLALGWGEAANELKAVDRF